MKMRGSTPVVLLVEDEPLLRFTLSEALREQHLIVLEAATADEALQLLELHEVDILCTDIRMPGRMNGADLARWVRRQRAGTRIVTMSGEATSIAIKIDADERFTKPLDYGELTRALVRLTSDRR